MTNFPFDSVGVVDLNNLYLSKDEFNRAMHKAFKKIRACKVAIFLGGFIVFGLVDSLIVQKKRIDALEQDLNSKIKNETAG